MSSPQCIEYSIDVSSTIYVFLAGLVSGYVLNLPTVSIINSIKWTTNSVFQGINSLTQYVFQVDNNIANIKEDVAYIKNKLDELSKDKPLTDTETSDDEMDKLFAMAEKNFDNKPRTIHDVIKDTMNVIDYDPEYRVSDEDEALVLRTLRKELTGQPVDDAVNLLKAYGFGMRVLYINNGPLLIPQSEKYNALTIGVKVRDRKYDFLKREYSDEAVIFKVLDVGGLDTNRKGGKLDDLNKIKR